MRKMICATLAMLTLSAHAQQGFLVPVDKKNGQEIQETTKPLGPIQWLPEVMEVEGEQMVAASNVREVWVIMFNTYGTPFLVYQKNGQPPMKLQIGAKGAGNQGNFEMLGFPYIIRRNQLVTIDDTVAADLLRRAKPLKWNKGLRVFGESALGGSVLGLIDAAFVSHSMIFGGLVAAATAAAVWAVEFRDQFFGQSLFDQRREIDLFTKKVDVGNVVGYEEIKVNNVVTDIILKIQNGKGAPVETRLMSQIIQEAKLTPDFRSNSFISYLTKKNAITKN